MTPRHVAVFGAAGGIGGALARHYRDQGAQVSGIARRPGPEPGMVWYRADFTDEVALAQCAEALCATSPPDLVLVTSGQLSGPDLAPEKSLRQQNAGAFAQIFEANTIAPALIAKHILPKMRRDGPGVFAALSARVGSIGDNRLGGWHSYRASKAALNMLIRCYAIEMARTHPQTICVGLHPGTVDTSLSAPFQGNVPPDKLFSPAQSAAYLASVISGLTVKQSGQVFDWAGKRIPN